MVKVSFDQGSNQDSKRVGVKKRKRKELAFLLILDYLTSTDFRAIGEFDLSGCLDSLGLCLEGSSTKGG